MNKGGLAVPLLSSLHLVWPSACEGLSLIVRDSLSLTVVGVLGEETPLRPASCAPSLPLCTC